MSLCGKLKAIMKNIINIFDYISPSDYVIVFQKQKQNKVQSSKLIKNSISTHMQQVLLIISYATLHNMQLQYDTGSSLL